MSSFFITCAQGLAPYVIDELAALGIESTSDATGVRFEGGLKEAYQALLWTRCGSRVLLQLKAGSMKDLDDLHRQLSGFPWSTHMSDQSTFVIQVTTKRAQHIHTQYAAQRVKDAIVDYFDMTTGGRPSVEKTDPDLRFYVHIQDTAYTLYLDLSGEPLHKRGFRTEQGVAPIKENLAAALLYRSKWPEKAKEHQDFIDPLCGAGTILIEAALMARDIAPGLFRRGFGFENWRGHNEHTWGECVKIAKHRAEVGANTYQGKLYGVERNARMIGITKANADRAGILKNMSFAHQMFEHFKKPADMSEKGLIVTNPPYGERLGEKEELKPTYIALGDWLRAYEGYEAGIITSDVELGKQMGLRARKVNKFYNGALECVYLQFAIEPQYFVDRKAAEERQEKRDHDEIMSEGGIDFFNRLTKNRKKWEKWAKQNHVMCYRTYDSDLPEFNVAIDRYDQSLVIYEYKAPKSIDPEKAAKRLEKIKAIVPIVFSDLKPENIHFKLRERKKGTEQYEKENAQGDFFAVEENGSKFWVNLVNYLDTGLFLDHRNVRKMIQEKAKNTNFLNLFAYTGSASIFAAAGGAKAVTTVDMSKTYLKWAENNFALNGFNGKAYQFIQKDVLEWLTQTAAHIEALPLMKKRDARYDLIFMDPPSFSNSKRMSDVLDIQRDHIRLINDAMTLLTKEGLLIFSTNLRNFKMEPELFEEYDIQDVSRETLPMDFARDPKIRQCYLIHHKNV
ncbi:bifunctional 23S rRNA (guanine(2069)-N(7))-methyltransferase RlmK/23S rRNA (guanine(2445)-N(2))-methyltransferase RlmL [Wohlfahrtiimonas chitiniclastica]|uniref:bifunctional 23S rRNA (guanine(2069)-N(7))-methyltransferase RlmK/23S rRNA (guanine(2445)-N(2))-methyltransferase RlmL n=1 Tax=Wohlfahrtiimonas chitiniclastica TaxID=400946 RepID=UPI001BCBDF6E|nr:bifunctional 23S rRNA (guanine(2069)-N(7))-methyltransferase RlmK/23S rRNA (guanine(2445)-N(2))-methyltransferase RlmL [Wohlfahrtiimonas chitiniclastica]MBS7837053.1 bifunctional 23S rRNA (guanine(2069)-N(7))-methyltransferase RlmK/23S rRNA (guanine(2445)-N(2))-methyltransferase RlmL [Wohlfahrtiimonas chitiniclastica]